jgi:hypothetical protein
MNDEPNVVAWMIGGGPRAVDPAELRNAVHLRAIAAGRRAVVSPSLGARLSAAAAAFRPAAPVQAPDVACCAA